MLEIGIAKKTTLYNFKKIYTLHFCFFLSLVKILNVFSKVSRTISFLWHNNRPISVFLKQMNFCTVSLRALYYHRVQISYCVCVRYFFSIDRKALKQLKKKLKTLLFQNDAVATMDL